MFRIAAVTGALAARSLRTGAAREPTRSRPIPDPDAIDVAGFRAQRDSADAAGTKEWMQWNRLDRGDPAVPPR